MAESNVWRDHSQGWRVEVGTRCRRYTFVSHVAFAFIDVHAQRDFAVLPRAQTFFPAQALQGEVADGVTIEPRLIERAASTFVVVKLDATVAPVVVVVK